MTTTTATITITTWVDERFLCKPRRPEDELKKKDRETVQESVSDRRWWWLHPTVCSAVLCAIPGSLCRDYTRVYVALAMPEEKLLLCGKGTDEWGILANDRTRASRGH